MLSKSNKRRKIRYAFYVLFSAALFMAAFYLGANNQNVVNVLVSMGSAVLAIAIVRAWKERKGEPMYDERWIKINRTVMSYTLSITYLLIAVLILVNYFDIVQMSAEGALSILLFSIAFLQPTLMFFMSRKGDVQ